MPTYEWFWPEFMDGWRRRRGKGHDIYEEYEIDVVSIGPDIAPHPGLFRIIQESPTDTVFRNGWGMVCRKVHGAAMLDFLEFPIVEENDFSSYTFMDPGSPSRYNDSYVDDLSLEKALPFDAQARRLGAKHFVLGSVLDPYECLWRLRGVTGALMDFYDRPDFADCMISRVTDFMIALGIGQIDIGGVPGVFILGDVAYRNGPLFSPVLYREKILPSLTRMCGEFKKRGAAVFYHTDGNCTALIDMFIEAGVDVLNPLENAAGMDLPALVAKYGRRLSYMGGLDKRRFMHQRELEEEVRAKCAAFGDGGLIAAVDHSVGPDIPIENYEHYVSLIHGLTRKGSTS
jgi:hypothetical protein